MTTRQRLDRSREWRLWMVQVGVPIMTAGVALASNPESRAYCKGKVDATTAFIKKHLPNKKKERFVKLNNR